MLERVQRDPRRQFGWEPSALASPEEKRAYQASILMPEIAAGRASVAQLPEQYGGRPTGASRRSMRMQAAWDETQKQQLEQQRLAQQMEMENRRLVLQERDQFLQEQEYNRKIKEYEAKQDISGQAEMESNNILDWLGGRAVDQQGNPIPKPDPKTPEFQTEFLRRISENPLGAELNKGIIEQYMGANKTYLDAQRAKETEESIIAREERMAGRQIAAEERSAGRQAAIRQEEKAAEEEKGIVSQEREIDKQIREQRQILAGLQGQKQTTTSEKAATEARNKMLDLRIEKAALRGLVFETEEEANAANIPSGSTIYIGRKPFKVD